MIPPPPWAGLLVVAFLFLAAWSELRRPALILGCLGLAVYRPKTAVLLWVALAGTVMVPLCTVRNSAVYIGTVFLPVLLLVALRRRLILGHWALPRSKLTVPLLAVATVAALSGVQGAVFYDPSVAGTHRFLLAQVYATALVGLSVGAAFIVADQLRASEDLRWMCWTIVGLAVLMLLASLTPVPFFQAPQWAPIIITHGVVLVYAAALFDPSMTIWKRALGFGLVAVAVFQLVARPFFFPGDSQWISGWLMIGVSIAFITWVKVPRIMHWVLIPAATAFAYLEMPLLVRVYQLAQREGDFTRLYIWHDALRMAFMRPLLGVGPGNYMDYAERYARVDLSLGSAHGNYQQIAAEMGILGLAFLGWVFIRAFVVGWRLYRTLDDRFQRQLVLAVIAALAGQVVAAVIGDYLIPAYHNGGHTNICATLYTWVMLGALMAIEGASPPSKDASGSITRTPG